MRSAKWIGRITALLLAWMFMGCLAGASAGAAGEKQIMRGRWVSDEYELNAWVAGDGVQIIVTRMDEAAESMQHWVFGCGLSPEDRDYQAAEYRWATLEYDENNVAVERSSDTALPCETRFFLNDRDQLVIQNAPDARLENRTFRRETEEEAAEGNLEIGEAQFWWLTDTDFSGWSTFRPVEVKDNDWFWVYAMPHDVYALFEGYQDQGVISYLILGEERALLWDTGMGIGDIRRCVEQLTNLPVTVLNSHDHFDHTGGNWQFDRVMCYNIDSAVRTLTEGQTHEYLKEYVDPKAVLNPPAGFNPDTFARIGKAPTATVEDGQIIDLGGRKLEVIYTPGHSESAIMLVDEQNGILFTGDTWYPGPLYAYFEDASLEDYVRSMRRAEAVIRDRKIEWVFGSHNEVIPGTELFCRTADFLEDVLEGKVDCVLKGDRKVYTMDRRISLEMKAEEGLPVFFLDDGVSAQTPVVANYTWIGQDGKETSGVASFGTSPTDPAVPESLDHVLLLEDRTFTAVFVGTPPDELTVFSWNKGVFSDQEHIRDYQENTEIVLTGKMTLKPDRVYDFQARWSNEEEGHGVVHYYLVTEGLPVDGGTGTD